MTRINIIVEGETEKIFINQTLTPYLSLKGIFPSARSVETGRQGSKIFRGGLSSYLKAKNDIIRWHKQDPKSYITTMFDYYALPNDFPGFEEAKEIFLFSIYSLDLYFAAGSFLKLE